MQVTAQLTGYIGILSSLEWSYAGTIKINIVSLRIVRDGVSCSGWLTGQICRVGRLPSEVTMILVGGMYHCHLSMGLHGGSMQSITVGSLLAITTVIVLIVVLSVEGRGCVVTFNHGWWAGIKVWFGIIHKDGRLTLEGCSAPFVFIRLAFAANAPHDEEPQYSQTGKTASDTAYDCSGVNGA
jgi:hypothetical protein